MHMTTPMSTPAAAMAMAEDKERHQDTNTGVAPRLALSPGARERMRLVRQPSMARHDDSWMARRQSLRTVGSGGSGRGSPSASTASMYRATMANASSAASLYELYPSTSSSANGRGAAATTSSNANGTIPVLNGASSAQGVTHELILSGTLTKRGHFFKNWLPRFFILSRHSLNYYKKNPQAPGKEVSAAMEKKLLRGEICRSDVIKVEATNTFKNRAYTFALIVRKVSRRSNVCTHKKESGLVRKRSAEGATILYYIQAGSEAERQRWIKALQRWIDGEAPTKIGRKILQYILNNEYTARYEQKVNDQMDGGWPVASTALSPAAQAGRKVEEEYPVLASLLREMHDCHHEDELVFILDQILGEVTEGAFSSSIKKLVAAAGEVKLESSPEVWSEPVKRTYGMIMKALYAQTASSAVESRSGTRAPHHRPVLLPPTRQISDGGENAPESSFHRHYKLGRKLGSGAYSVVHIATNRKTCKQVAVKCIAKSSLSSSDVIALKQEVKIMSDLDHPNLVPLLDYFEEERYYYIVTPLCTGGELFDTLVNRKTYTEEDARELMRKLASAIAYVHSKGIVHRDLKPENILLKSSAPGAEVIVADFGFARPMKGARPGTACGTPGYIAPEIVKGQPYGSEVDCWSLGVILFILLCGYPPFPGENHAAILDKVVNADYSLDSPSWDQVSKEAKSLVTQLLNVDREQRLSALGILNHPWMNPHRLNMRDSCEEIGRIARVNSDLLPVLNQMRKHSLTHDQPKIRPSDMEVDTSELQKLSIDGDMAMLDEELANFDDFEL